MSVRSKGRSINELTPGRWFEKSRTDSILLLCVVFILSNNRLSACTDKRILSWFYTFVRIHKSYITNHQASCSLIRYWRVKTSWFQPFIFESWLKSFKLCIDFYSRTSSAFIKRDPSCSILMPKWFRSEVMVKIIPMSLGWVSKSDHLQVNNFKQLQVLIINCIFLNCDLQEAEGCGSRTRWW